MHKAEIAADKTVSLDESTFREMVLEVSFIAAGCKVLCCEQR
jgi:hypothetical protein